MTMITIVRWLQTNDVAPLPPFLADGVAILGVSSDEYFLSGDFVNLLLTA
ncbi:hypothetical protein [Phyllobacterium salinisoli]|nr:hypothetical protein [Phyllobacterium salinisoli]